MAGVEPTVISLKPSRSHPCLMGALMIRPKEFADLTCQQIFELSYPNKSLGRAMFVKCALAPPEKRVVPDVVKHLCINPTAELLESSAVPGFCMACMSTTAIQQTAPLYAIIHPETVAEGSANELRMLASKLMHAFVSR